MKRFFAVLGVIFVIIIVVGAIGFGYLAYRGKAFDKESKAYVDAAIPAIVTSWNKKELLDRASPEFKKEVSDAQIDQLFHQFTALGRFMTFDSATGQSLTYASPQTGKVVTADYQARAYFEKGGALIKVKLIKHADQWQISSFNVQGGPIGGGYDPSLDKESKAYADVAIAAIITDWNEKQLLDRASPEFKQTVTRQQFDQLFHRFHNLGHLKKCDPAQGHAGALTTTQAGKQIGAEYYADATFDKGAAVIDMTLIKHGDQWQIVGFFVKPPATPAH
jgi:dimeric dUTPase (all-alpha-NTP-PPase superfamily)